MQRPSPATSRSLIAPPIPPPPLFEACPSYLYVLPGGPWSLILLCQLGTNWLGILVTVDRVNGLFFIPLAPASFLNADWYRIIIPFVDNHLVPKVNLRKLSSNDR